MPQLPPSHLYASPAQGYNLGYTPGYTDTHSPAGQSKDNAPGSLRCVYIVIYRRIHDRWKSLKLEPGYILKDLNKTLHKDDVPVNGVLATSAHILETSFQIYSQFSEKDS